MDPPTRKGGMYGKLIMIQRIKPKGEFKYEQKMRPG
jgi:hypothetical protein